MNGTRLAVVSTCLKIGAIMTQYEARSSANHLQGRQGLQLLPFVVPMGVGGGSVLSLTLFAVYVYQ